MIDGYEKITPLEPDERRILGELLGGAHVRLRSSCPRRAAALYDDPDAVMRNQRGQAVKILRLLRVDWAGTRFARRLGGREPGAGVAVPAAGRTPQARNRSGDDRADLPASRCTSSAATACG